MFCIKCGKQMEDGSKFCPYCGAKIADDELGKTIPPINSQEEPKKKSKIPLLVIAMICVVLVGYFGFSAYSRMATYNTAVEKYENSDYAEAAELFTSLTDYKDSASYVTECQYQQAIKDLEAGDYNKAIEVFTQLGGYEDSKELYEKAISERKYSKFNLEIDLDSEIYSEIALKTPEEVETALSESMYGEWYSTDTGEKITVDYYQINNRDYSIKSATCLDGWITVYFCYTDDPDHELSISTYFEAFTYIDEWIDTMDIYSLDSEEAFYYRSVSQEEYDNLVALNAEAEAQQPMYTDSEIIEKTFSAFNNKIKGNYSGVGVLYHSASYSDAYVEYDWASKTYYCSMTGKYTTNGFDFWGTSTQTYFISAAYVDTGAGLSLASISIN